MHVYAEAIEYVDHEDPEHRLCVCMYVCVCVVCKNVCVGMCECMYVCMMCYVYIEYADHEDPEHRLCVCMHVCKNMYRYI